MAENLENKVATCGLVMPISPLDGCTADHWMEVKSIITDAIEQNDAPKFTVKLVSDADDVGVIQKRIVQNVYSSDVVVCDVSGKNPNVMFELGLRLAFDKATVIVKDDKTDYSFDTGIIEHVTYPRDLRFAKIVEFKKTLAGKVAATYKASVADPTHSPFLKNFGSFQVANLTQTEVTPDKLVIEMLSDLQSEVSLLRQAVRRSPSIRRGVSGKNDPEVMKRILSSILRCRDERGIRDTKELLGNSSLYAFVYHDIEAPKWFSSTSEFENAVDQVVSDLMPVP
jgi:hypothetical protein